MRWLGQHITNNTTRLDSATFITEPKAATSDTDRFLVYGNQDSATAKNRLLYRTGAEVLLDIGAGTSNFYQMFFVTDSGSGSKYEINKTNITINILGSDGIGVTNSGNTITVVAVPGEIDHDSLSNFASNEHFTQANITTVGTIGTGVWQGTAIASEYLDADTAHLTTDQTFTGRKSFDAFSTFNSGITVTSESADNPLVKIVNTTDDDQAGRLMFEKLRDDDGVATGQNLGEIWFTGQDSAQNTEDYAYILGEIDVSTDGEESGILKLGVANHDGGNGRGLILIGGSEDDEIDATLGLGANSVVTIPGNIDLAGDIDVDGTLETDALTIGGAAVLAQATTSAVGAVELATTAEADTGTDTTKAVTPEGLKSHVDTKYSYTYMTWSASAKPARDGSNNPEWMVPNINKGIYEEDWNKDTDITSTTTGDTTYNFSRQITTNSIILPHAGILVGFHAIGRNNNTDLTFKAGLFHADNGLGGAGADGDSGQGIDYGHTAATNEFTLRCVATAEEAEASGGEDGTASHNFMGPCQLISNAANLTVQAGDAIMPAIMGNSTNSTDEIYVTMTIILKIPLV